MRKLTIYFEGVKLVLKNRIYLISSMIVFSFLLWLFIYIPVRNIPGNDFAFQLTLLKPQDFFLLMTLAFLTSLSINMNIYSFRQKATLRAGASIVSQGGLGSFAGVVASIFGTATCASCVVSLFSFLGIGTIFFLLEYRNYIVAVSIILLIFSLYFTSKKIFNQCNNCHVKRN